MPETVSFAFERLDIPDVVLISNTVHYDSRGYFFELFRKDELERAGLTGNWLQDNVSFSRKGVLRGLHYQLPPHAQAKLVTVVAGEIFDVAVDLRRGSPTFLKWTGVRLSSEKPQLLYVPSAFAHGFCVLSDEAYVLYKVDAPYDPKAERGVIWNDPALAIDWPLPAPILSPRDAALGSTSTVELFSEST